ncbi:MAG: hypothetical protein EBY21_03380 [Alphaproteobacteria bacterium]|nr:hypothetical protein [Alphaproteobacteria bacterium]
MEANQSFKSFECSFHESPLGASQKAPFSLFSAMNLGFVELLWGLRLKAGCRTFLGGRSTDQFKGEVAR